MQSKLCFDDVSAYAAEFILFARVLKCIFQFNLFVYIVYGFLNCELQTFIIFSEPGNQNSVPSPNSITSENGVIVYCKHIYYKYEVEQWIFICPQS